ncbi:hypothetical protein BC835DRAFT_705273 [Cytidiella melzeri]|nr:hypothetical protein BC835DRAFT_705273 [Cytidiella melzeri]
MSPKLYTFGLSVWSAAPELAAEELGTSVEPIIINVVEGENFSPKFLKLNPAGTLPTLVADDGKIYTNTTDVVKYLVGSSSKKVTPGNSALIAKIHEDKYDPNFILLTTRNDEEFTKAASGFPAEFVSNRQNALLKYSASSEGAAFKDFYNAKIDGNGSILKIYKGETPNADFFATSTSHWETIADFILKDLNDALPSSGFIGGAEPGEDDFHVGAWLTRVAWVAGATPVPEGINALEKELKAPVPAKVASYWKAWIVRPSFKKVYEKTLH